MGQTKKETPPREAETGRLISITNLLRMLRPVRRFILSCTALSVFGSVCGMVPYIIIAEIVRTLFTGSGFFRMERIWLWVAVIAGCAALRIICGFLSMIVGHHAFAVLMWGLRLSIVEKLREVPLGWFKSNGASSVRKAMTGDLDEMEALVIDAVRQLAGALSGLAVSLGYLFLIDPRMASIEAAVLAAMLVSYRVAMRSQTRHTGRMLSAQGRINAASVEYAEGIGVVKVFGAEGSFKQRFNAAIDDFFNAMSEWVRETRYSSALSYVLSSDMINFGLIMSAGLFFAGKGMLPMINLIPFVIVGIGLPSVLLPVTAGLRGIRSGRGSAARIEDILRVEPLPRTVDPKQPFGNSVEFMNVSYSYTGLNKAVDNISVKLNPGTVTALVGPSGSGKTTIANLLPRFYDVEEGKIMIGGVDIRDMTQRDLLSMLALVFQDTVLIHDSVFENIRLGRPDAADQEVIEAAKAANIHHVIEAMPEGYYTVLGSERGGLSGGEQQRLTIARAMLSKAPVVILDEATSSLDIENEIEVQKAIARLAVGKTILVIAHRLETIKDADQILVLHRGGIVERGVHDELLAKNGLYAAMWRDQIKEYAL
jgi:ATP-binding cassette subfamily B protein